MITMCQCLKFSYLQAVYVASLFLNSLQSIRIIRRLIQHLFSQQITCGMTSDLSGILGPNLPPLVVPVPVMQVQSQEGRLQRLLVPSGVLSPTHTFPFTHSFLSTSCGAPSPALCTAPIAFQFRTQMGACS